MHSLLFQSDASLWRIAFFITAGYYLIGNTLFVVFGTAKVQPWNYSELPQDNTYPSVEKGNKKEMK